MMISFELDDQQLQLRETVRRFAEKDVAPIAEEIDRIADPKQAFAGDASRKACELGFHTLLIPEKWGGLGGSLMDLAIMVEELAKADVGFAMNFGVSCSISRMIANNATDDQAERWLIPYCDMSGERHHLFAFGGTEPSGGTEIFCADPNPEYGTRTFAKKSGDTYVINGAKNFITNTSRAELYGCMARTDKKKPNAESNSIFFLTPDTPGFSIGKIEDKMGHRAMSNGELIFEDVTIPVDCRLGEEGAGLGILMETYHVNGVVTGALALGLACAAYDMAVDYAKQRIIWGQPITQYQSVSNMLVDMKMQIETTRLLLQRVAWAGDNQIHDADIHPAMVKVYASEMARKVTVDAMQVLGGSGYMKDYPAEKYVRDSMVMPIYDGTNQVLKHFMALEMYS